MTARVATDVGGTFTDLVAVDADGVVWATKVPTTPAAFADGVLGAVDDAGIDLGAVAEFLHGCTVVINAITERRGARTALITTAGFRDVLEIGRGNRPDMYNLLTRKPVPLVPRRHRFEVTERVGADGAVVTPPALEELEPIAERCRRDGIEAVAICLLHAYAWPGHERQLRDALAARLPGVPISVSSDVSRTWREYERTSTTVLNAYVQPPVARYLGALDEQLSARGLAGARRIMGSAGGTVSPGRARAVPIELVESGPAASIAGAAEIGRVRGERDVLHLDIGGTTAKCTLIRDATPQHTSDYRLERSEREPGIPVSVPVVDIVEIGAGGGSIARHDPAGALTVGPQSAGAVPGPACYGHGGTEATVTDAMVLAGVIDPDYFLGGRLRVDRELAHAALDRLGARIGRTPEQVAGGIIRLANARMLNALRLVSVRRGHDPRDFVLVASGGGGPLHAAALGAELRVKRIVIPPLPGFFSAWGMLVAPPRVDLARTVVAPLDAATAGGLAERFAGLEAQARAALEHPAGAVTVDRGLELRYRGQEHGVRVALGADAAALDAPVIVAAFHAAHEQRYTFALPDEAVELVTLHLGVELPRAAVGVGAAGAGAGGASAGSAADPVKGRRRVDLDGDGGFDCLVLDRERLRPGATHDGPLLVEEPSSTTLVLPGQRLEVDAPGNLVISAAP